MPVVRQRSCRAHARRTPPDRDMRPTRAICLVVRRHVDFMRVASSCCCLGDGSAQSPPDITERSSPCLIDCDPPSWALSPFCSSSASGRSARPAQQLRRRHRRRSPSSAPEQPPTAARSSSRRRRQRGVRQRPGNRRRHRQDDLVPTDPRRPGGDGLSDADLPWPARPHLVAGHRSRRPRARDRLHLRPPLPADRRGARR
jgi:hypothetical protein